MIPYYRLQNLLSQWEGRLSSKQNTEYCFAIKECSKDLETLIADSIEEETKDRELEIFNSMPDEEIQAWLDDQEADAQQAPLWY